MNLPSLSATAAVRRNDRTTIRDQDEGRGPRHRGARADRVDAVLEAGWLAGNLLVLTLLGLLVDQQLNRAEDHAPLLTSSVPDASFARATT
ncbi:hypothetical protein [Streptomyces sp. NRRL WC-3742]|uniref:hypothetical protein n=1 Tax=Streptomyces sp. NRRL WC-3742 TaxID=1463934 RepID=UPI0004C7392D|nr:hypothetical protein [Streptomyces sp. NRRL WC-3742]